MTTMHVSVQMCSIFIRTGSWRLLVLVIAGFLACSLRAQDSLQVAQLIARMDSIHRSPAATYFFTIDSVPDVVIQKMVDNVGSNDPKKPMTRLRLMADRGHRYEATDNISSEAPRRRFVVGQRLGDELIFFYFHGGRGNHVHVVYANVSPVLKISAFATLQNWDELKALELDSVKLPTDGLRVPLVFARDLKAIASDVYDEFDLF